MAEVPYIAEAGALIGYPARANSLAALMDGKARTATDLAYVAGVSPQTTSAHLAKLREGRLLTMDRQGRHRYYRLANSDVVEALEALMRVAAIGPLRHRPAGPRDEALRRARTCYDHLAGQLAVALADGLVERRYLAPEEENFAPTSEGEAFLRDFGIDLRSARRKRRAYVRPCLDWSERRPHLAGAVGAALAERCFQRNWIERVKDTRALKITTSGNEGFRTVFGLGWAS